MRLRKRSCPAVSHSCSRTWGPSQQHATENSSSEINENSVNRSDWKKACLKGGGGIRNQRKQIFTIETDRQTDAQFSESRFQDVKRDHSMQTSSYDFSDEFLHFCSWQGNLEMALCAEVMLDTLLCHAWTPSLCGFCCEMHLTVFFLPFS